MNRALSHIQMAMLRTHALCDAVFGALAIGDIGQYFPPSDEKWQASSSDQFLQFALEKVSDAGGYVTLLDITVICEAPKSDHTET